MRSSASHLLSVPWHNLSFGSQLPKYGIPYRLTFCSLKHSLHCHLKTHYFQSAYPAPKQTSPMRPDSLLRLWHYINHLLTYSLTIYWYKTENLMVQNSLEHCLGWSDKVTLVTEPFLSMHVFHMPLMRLLCAETSLTLDTSDQRVWHEVVGPAHVIREQCKCLERHVTASSCTPSHINM